MKKVTISKSGQVLKHIAWLEAAAELYMYTQLAARGSVGGSLVIVRWVVEIITPGARFLKIWIHVSCLFHKSHLAYEKREM